MGLPRQRLFASVLAIFLGGLGWTLTSFYSGWGALASRASYDWLQGLQRWKSVASDSYPAVLVYLDVDSHRELGQDPAGRWDRRLHARLVRRLAAAGARAVVFDVIFDDESPDPAADREFAAAMRGHGRVVLAAERRRNRQSPGHLPEVLVEAWTLPTEELAAAAAAVGGAELAVDDDFVVRRSERWLGEPPMAGLSWAAVGVAEEVALERGAPVPGEEWTRYYGRAMDLPSVSYYRALEPGEVDDRVFAGKVVFVGARPMAGAFDERRDELRHPLAAWGEAGTFMPAVEVHATQFMNWLRRDGLIRLAPGSERLLAVLWGIGVGLVLARLRPPEGALFAVGSALGMAVLAGVLCWREGLWFSWVIESLVLLPAGWGIAIVHYGIDWQLQRRRLEALRRQDQRKIERQAALIHRAMDAIVVTDLGGRVTYANPAGVRVLGLTGAGAEGVGEVGTGSFPPCLMGFAEKLERIVALGEWSGVIEIPESTGAIRIVETRWTPIRDTTGALEAVLILGSDVTERRRLEVDFLRAQKWEAVGSLAGGMAHDLNNRLAPALLGLQLLQESPLDEGTRRMLATIESHTRRGADTVRQVLRFLRGGSVEWTEIQPGELVRELESLLGETFPKSIRIDSLIAPRVGRVRGNSTQLQQALMNLCLNARDAMPEGGELTLAVDDVDLSAEEAAKLRGGRAGEYVLLAVSDSGTGIAPGHLGRIFDPLFTTKPEGKGTGLGLSSVARVVEQHGGCLGVTSELGSGSTFEVYLPRMPEPAGVHGSSSAASEG